MHLYSAAAAVFVLAGIFFRSENLATVGRMVSALVQPPVLEIGASPHGIAAGALVPAGGLVALLGATLIAFVAPNTLQIFALWDHPGAPARTAEAPRRIASAMWARPSACSPG
jgi:hypothetical protein